MSLDTWLREANRSSELTKQASIQPTLDTMSVDELEEFMEKVGMANPLVENAQYRAPVKLAAVSPTAALQAQILSGFMDKVAYLGPEGISALAFSAADMLKIAMDPSLRSAIDRHDKGVPQGKVMITPANQKQINADLRADKRARAKARGPKASLPQASSAPKRGAGTQSLFDAANDITTGRKKPPAPAVREEVKKAVETITEAPKTTTPKAKAPHLTVMPGGKSSSTAASKASKVLQWAGGNKGKLLGGAAALAAAGGGTAAYLNRKKLFGSGR